MLIPHPPPLTVAGSQKGSSNPLHLPVGPSHSQHKGRPLNSNYNSTKASRPQVRHLRVRGQLPSSGGRQGLVRRHGVDHRRERQSGGRNQSRAGIARADRQEIRHHFRLLRTDRQGSGLTNFHIGIVRCDHPFRNDLLGRFGHIQAWHG